MKKRLQNIASLDCINWKRAGKITCILALSGITDAATANRIEALYKESLLKENTTIRSYTLQDLVVKGKVTDTKGEALIGVSIKIKGTTIGATTNANGDYTLRVPDAHVNGTLIVSYVGFNSKEVAINGQQVLKIQLSENVKNLQEVVVVGYGTQRKSDVTGALTSVTAQTIQERPNLNVLQAVQGKAAGVVISTNLKPGEVPSVRIRGNRSLTASNDPLYVVDGIPIISALGVTSFSIADLNQNDIASIEVLKDASATAIYGSRGANGVILITTKKGSKGRVGVNYNSTVTSDSYKSLTDWMNSGEYIDRWRLALINGRQYNPAITNNADLSKPAVSWYPDPFLDATSMALNSTTAFRDAVWQAYEWEQYGVTPKLRATTEAEKALGWPAEVPVYDAGKIPTYNWLGDATRHGLTQNHLLSMSSGSETARLYLSLGYNGQKGVQKDQDYNRYNVNLNGDVNANKWLTLGGSAIASLAKQNYGISTNSSNTGAKDLYSRAAAQFPFAVPTDASGSFISTSGGGLNLNLFNPLIDIDQSINERRTVSALTNLFSEIKFTPWLKYRLNFGAQFRTFRNGAWTGPQATSHLGAKPNTAGYTRDENFSWVAENLLYVDQTFNKIHRLGVTLLQSAQKSRRESVNVNVTNSAYPISYWYDLGANTLGRADGFGSSFTENTLSSYMARINYTLMDKYLLTASGRYDGASVLAPGHKWDFFPSFALAWKLNEENFFKEITWIDQLKPRLGFGVTGNSSVNPYTTSGPLSQSPYAFGSNAAIGYLPQQVQNPDLGWEKTKQWNFGLDFSVIKSRVSGSLEYYLANTTDLIYSRNTPGASGYVQKFLNVGKTQNRGFELTLSTQNIDKKDFRWSTELNFTTNKEKIVELLNGKEDILASNLFIGQPLQVFYSYKNAGIWQNSTEDQAEMAKYRANGFNFFPGTVRVVDKDNNYKLDANDYFILGTARPKWTGGITNTFRYKALTLSSFIFARIGQTYFGGYPGSLDGGVNPNGRVENDIWSWDNPDGRFPMPNTGAVTNYSTAQQYNKASFAVVRNISLSYDLPAKLLNKYSVKSLQLNVQVLNPFIFGGDLVKWGINPDDETNWASVSSANSPGASPLGGTNNNTILPQSFVFGIRAGF